MITNKPVSQKYIDLVRGALAAPDVDAEVFKQRIEPAVFLAENITLYSSSDDLPLWTSEKLHEYPRAGQGGEDVLLLYGVDTIDVSSIRGGILEHSYFAKELLSDLKSLFSKYKIPDSRGFNSVYKNNRKYWLVPE